MDDLEITKRCAEAMGWHTGKPASKVVAYKVSGCAIIAGNDAGGESVYDPLHDDGQAMALVKKFWMVIEPPLRDVRAKYKLWYANVPAVSDNSVQNKDLNRAICECVAKLEDR